MWLRGADALRVQHAHVHAVPRAALVELREHRAFRLRPRDHEDTANLQRDAAFRAVRAQLPVALEAEARLRRAGLDVVARMHDPRVAPALVKRRAGLLLEDHHAAPRAGQMQRGARADGASPDDDDVDSRHPLPSAMGRERGLSRKRARQRARAIRPPRRIAQRQVERRDAAPVDLAQHAQDLREAGAAAARPRTSGSGAGRRPRAARAGTRRRTVAAAFGRSRQRSSERWCVRSPSWRTITSPGRTRARIAPVISSGRRSRSQSPTDTVHSTIRKPASAAARAAASVRKPKGGRKRVTAGRSAMPARASAASTAARAAPSSSAVAPRRKRGRTPCVSECTPIVCPSRTMRARSASSCSRATFSPSTKNVAGAPTSRSASSTASVHRPFGPSSNVSATVGVAGDPRRYTSRSRSPSGNSTPAHPPASITKAASRWIPATEPGRTLGAAAGPPSERLCAGTSAWSCTPAHPAQRSGEGGPAAAPPTLAVTPPYRCTRATLSPSKYTSKVTHRFAQYVHIGADSDGV